jgi:hypothetical protein
LKRLLLLLLLSTLWHLAAFNPDYYANTEYPPMVPIAYRRPGFWIASHPAPDSLIMDSAEIAEFNRQAIQSGQCFSLEYDSLLAQAPKMQQIIQSNFLYAKEMGRYHSSGKATTNAFWTELQSNLNLAEYNTKNIRFAFPMRFTNQRLAPHQQELLSKPGDSEFDYLQNSGADLGEATVIYHESKDGLWLFGSNSASAGWYLKADMALLSRQQWLAYKDAAAFVICSSDKSDLWLDSSATEYYGFIRMGNRLPLLGHSGSFYKVALPSAEAAFAYISVKDAGLGYLPYTAREVYQQAFKLQNAPYGWGDLNGEYDCSGLIKQLFQCFGIFLPRNGAEQHVAAIELHAFAKENAVTREVIIAEKAEPAASLLRLPGHIMLYLGSVEGKAYALHALWGVRHPLSKDTDAVIAVNKTVVSDLSLGEGSKRKSLLDRLTGISKVAKP